MFGWRPRCMCGEDVFGFRIGVNCPRHGDTWTPEPVGPVSAFNVKRLTEEYVRREEMDADEFERRLDEFIEHAEPYLSTGMPPLSGYIKNLKRTALGDIEMVAASAAVVGQSSAGVLGDQDLHQYAEQLRFSALPEPVYIVGQEEPACTLCVTQQKPNSSAQLDESPRIKKPVSATWNERQ